MKKFSQNIKSKLVATGVAVYGLAGTSASAAIVKADLPVPDYGNIENAALVGFAVVLAVGLLMKAKSFFR